MPFGPFSINHRIGIANFTYPNAVSFGQTVLRLTPGFPVYGQQLVHSTKNQAGPYIAAAEWCDQGNVDNDFSATTVLREISAHSTQWARRNLSSAPFWNFITHRRDYANQIYYVGNEVEMGSGLEIITPDPNGCNCWNPPDRIIDDFFASCFSATIPAKRLPSGRQLSVR